MSAAPPPFAERLAAALVADAELREAVLGDLAEEHDAVTRARGAQAADRAYRREVLRSVPGLTRVSVMRAGPGTWLRIAAAVVVGSVALSVLSAAGEALLDRVIGDAAPGDWRRLAASLTAGLLCAVVGGYAAAAVGRRAPLLSAAALGGVCVVAGLGMLVSGSTVIPLPYRIGMTIIVLPAALAGGVLRVAHSDPRPTHPPNRR
jgi:hypothetical protein